MNLLIYNAIVVTLDEKDNLLNPGYIFINENRISEVGKGTPPSKFFDQSERVINAQHKLVMPGLINAHTHAAMSLFRGLADDLSLENWLKNFIFPAEKQFVNRDFVYWGTLLAGWEMIKTGTTCIADGYFFEDMAIEACKVLGLRGIFAQGILDYPTPDVLDPAETFNNAENFLKKWQGSDLIIPALFAHSPYTCSKKTLKRAKKLTEEYKTFLFIHTAETRWEVEEIKRHYGITPIIYLHRLGILNKRTILIHVNWISEEEFSILADTGVAVVHCPESNLKLAAGLCPVSKLLSKGIPVILGTDSAASNNNLNLFQEMDTMAKVHKGFFLNPSIMPTRTVIKMATNIPAKVFDLNIGQIKKSALADIVIINLKHPSLFPFYDPHSLIVYTPKEAET
ncbi:MAG TPA: amidohydrolase, partial [Candidatus Desulfofervidus auxilii]|nr:amidohydrolase [Candidatus Desulfofervidus auxilii]